MPMMNPHTQPVENLVYSFSSPRALSLLLVGDDKDVRLMKSANPMAPSQSQLDLAFQMGDGKRVVAWPNLGSCLERDRSTFKFALLLEMDA